MPVFLNLFRRNSGAGPTLAQLRFGPSRLKSRPLSAEIALLLKTAKMRILSRKLMEKGPASVFLTGFYYKKTGLYINNLSIGRFVVRF